MLNIEGLVKVTKIEDMSSKAAKAVVYFGTKRKGSGGKDENEEWENSFFKAVLVGKAFEKSQEIYDKDPIYVTKGIVKNVSYEDKQGNIRNYLSLTIFDFIFGEDEIDKKLKEISNSAHGVAANTETKPSRRERPQRKQGNK
jgi:single-stranded DNA-binding protein